MIQADIECGCWTLPAHSGRKKPLWALPPKRKSGRGSAYYPLEDATKGTKKGFRGVVVDPEGRVYGSRKCDVLKSGVKRISLGKRVEVETSYRVFCRDDGSFAMVQVLELLDIPEQYRVEPVQATVPVLPIAPPIMPQPAVYPSSPPVG